MPLCSIANLTVGTVMMAGKFYLNIDKNNTKISGIYGAEIDKFMVHKNER